jgi:hypothetical protein
MNKDDMHKLALEGGIVGGPLKPDGTFATWYRFQTLMDAVDWAQSMPDHDDAKPVFIDAIGRVIEMRIVEK